MAIMTRVDNVNWSLVQQIVHEVLTQRKFQFDIPTIQPVIKKRLIEVNISPEITDCIYFRILLIDALDSLVEKCYLYPLNNLYIPTDYMILHDYDTKSSNLLYLYDNTIPNSYLNIDNNQKVHEVLRRDFLLTGGFTNYKQDNFVTPKISFEEISSLYHDFIREGAEKDVAIKHVLNYYSAQSLQANQFFGKVVAIQPKSRKKIFRKETL